MSVVKDILVPDIGDYRDVPVIEILAKAGDHVASDAPLLTLESDKAAMEVPSPFAGKIVEICASLGAKVSQGALIARIEIAEEPRSETPAPRPAAQAPSPVNRPDGKPAPAASPVNQVATQAYRVQSNTDAYATPSVRALARELGIDLARVQPTGPKGRIVREDVAIFVKGLAANTQAANGSATGLPPWPEVDFSAFGPISETSLTRIQKLAGGNLTRNWLSIPHVTNFDRADITDLDRTRQSHNKSAAAASVKLTTVAFLIKASAIALEEHPRFNASLSGTTLVQKHYVHVGFAADTPAGLVVPVIFNCNKKSVIDIAGEIIALSTKAREGQLRANEMQGGCFTVSSLGGVGGDGFTPIINAPEVAILGAGRARAEAVWDGVRFQPRLILPLSLSWDHRVVDGVAAARFLGRISALLSEPTPSLL